MDFQNRTVLVTGTGAGIGREIAAAFVKAGARVMANSRNPDHLRETAELLAPFAGDRLATYVADVGNFDEIQAMVAETTRRLGPIDILVNNAGIYPNAPVVDMPLAEWDAVYATNIRGPFMLCQAVARQMVQRGQGGKIVNVTSGAYRSARRGASHYCSSKAALDMFTRVLALELAEHHVNVNCVAPGLIEVGDRAGVSEEYKKTLTSAIPWGRIGQPPDIAHAVLFMASQEADYITGTTLEVDGGVLAGRYYLPYSKRS